LSIGVGMALGLRHLRSPGRVFVLLGDGELNEGQNWEAAQSGAHYRLGNLIGIVDRNSMGLDGRTEETMSIEPLADKWRAFNWTVHECDGHDLAALVRTFDAIPPAKHDQSDRPHMLIAHTVKGKGVKFMEESRLWHLGHLAGPDAAAAIQEIEEHAHA
jgi:transketolase